VSPLPNSTPHAVDADANAAFAADVRFYLSQTPRQLPSRYFYDPLGSALFEAITRLPWYHVTRAELGLLRAHAPAILGSGNAPARLVELGSGSGEKLAALISSGLPAGARLELHLIDVSAAALTAASLALGVLAGTQVVTHEASYQDGLHRVGRAPAAQGRTLAVFLGSNIGNFDPLAARDLLVHVRAALRSGDELLIGVDLVKPERDLLLAYDDPLGITAAFNRNLLVRLNRELDADIDLSGFRHAAVWNREASRVEMHLVSTRTQRIHIPRADCTMTLHEGERIWTESSYKFEPEALVALLSTCGFTRRAQWIDRDSQFALTLARA
jgi:dimethylhistidine N-methyltransferase